MERTLIIIKPDAVQRGLSGELIARFERRGLRIIGMKMILVSEALASKHYAEHEGKPFFPKLISYITSSPVIVLALEGPRAVACARNTIGSTRPYEAAAGTIRGDYGLEVDYNLVHGSDSPESGLREVANFFGEDELLTDWNRNVEPWIFNRA